MFGFSLSLGKDEARIFIICETKSAKASDKTQVYASRISASFSAGLHIWLPLLGLANYLI